MTTPTRHGRRHYESLVAQHAHVLKQLADLSASEAAKRAHVERTRPRLQAAEAAYAQAAKELEAVRREAGHGDLYGLGSATRRGQLERAADALADEIADSPWAPHT